MSTKGSWQRPCDQEQFNKNWDAIFGKTEDKDKKDEDNQNLDDGIPQR